jgi:hypothetical protein
MQTANVMVALGGDISNTVPKASVTAAEIAVLQAIHGDDAVFDIEPVGSVKRVNREERERLRVIYGNAKNREGQAIIDVLYPGAAARVFESLNELQISPDQFKVSARVALEDEEVEDEEADAKPAKKSAKGKGKAKAKVDDEGDDLPELSSDDDGFMN